MGAYCEGRAHLYCWSRPSASRRPSSSLDARWPARRCTHRLQRVTDSLVGHGMRVEVLAGWSRAWESRPRSAADLKEAAAHWDRAAQLTHDPSQKSELL